MCVAWTHEDWEHSDAQRCLEVSDNVRLLDAPVGASDECYRHAKRNVLTFSTHATPSFQVGSVPQQTLDDERRNGHHHIASLSYALKGTQNGLTSLQMEKKTRSPSNGQQMTKTPPMTRNLQPSEERRITGPRTSTKLVTCGNP